MLVSSLMQMAKDKKRTPATREYTINLHKRMYGITFKKRAPRAVKEVKKFASKMMNTADVRVDVRLNKAIWSQVRNCGAIYKVIDAFVSYLYALELLSSSNRVAKF